MRAWFATGTGLLERDPADTVSAQHARGFAGTPDQELAWHARMALLRQAVAEADGAAWTIVLEFDLLRLGKCIDAVVLPDRP